MKQAYVTLACQQPRLISKTLETTRFPRMPKKTADTTWGNILCYASFCWVAVRRRTLPTINNTATDCKHIRPSHTDWKTQHYNKIHTRLLI